MCVCVCMCVCICVFVCLCISLCMCELRLTDFLPCASQLASFHMYSRTWKRWQVFARIWSMTTLLMVSVVHTITSVIMTGMQIEWYIHCVHVRGGGGYGELRFVGINNSIWSPENTVFFVVNPRLCLHMVKTRRPIEWMIHMMVIVARTEQVTPS